MEIDPLPASKKRNAVDEIVEESKSNEAPRQSGRKKSKQA